MSQNWQIADKGSQFVQNITNMRCLAYHLIRNASQASNEFRDVTVWVDQGGEFVLDSAAIKAADTYFENCILLWIQTSGFDIQGNDGRHNEASVTYYRPDKSDGLVRPGILLLCH